MKRDFLALNQFTKEELDRLFVLTKELKEKQKKRIEHSMFGLQFLFDRFINGRVIKHPLVRRSRNLFILSHVLRPNAYLLSLSSHRLEVVLIQIGNLPELIHEWHHIRTVKPTIAEVLPYHVAVPLFNVHVVVLLSRL